MTNDAKPESKKVQYLISIIAVISLVVLVLVYYLLKKGEVNWCWLLITNLIPSAAVVLLGVAVVFFIFSLRGIPIGSALEADRMARKISTLIYAQEGPSSLNLSGGWKYTVIAKEGGYSHGGICNIVQNGSSLILQGTRQWKKVIDPSTKATKETQTEFHWASTWGAITGPYELRFIYRIFTDDGPIEGYCSGYISLVGKAATRILGNLFQLPPNVLQGTLNFEKVPG